MSATDPIQLSVVIPVFNEAEAIGPLLEEIRRAVEGPRSAEIIVVDDGSTDGTDRVVEAASAKDRRIRLVQLARNYGQTAAIAAGLRRATGSVVVTMDGDGQNDPADIPALLVKLEEGYDVVSGWRRPGADPFWSRTVPSKLANWLIARVSGVPLHDFGCTLKAYRREVLSGVRLYGEMHRFIPVYAALEGGRIAEMEVRHRARTTGRAKYGLGRTFKVLLDLLTLKFLGSYLAKPMYVFGGTGLACMGAGVLAGAFALVEKYGWRWLGYPEMVWVHRNPKILLAVFLFIVGFQLLMLGLLAEVIIRSYFGQGDREPVTIRRTVNLESR